MKSLSSEENDLTQKSKVNHPNITLRFLAIGLSSLLFVFLLKGSPLIMGVLSLAWALAALMLYFGLASLKKQYEKALSLAHQKAENTAMHLKTLQFRVQRLQEDLREANRQARLSHQMTLLGQFVAGFMHEVKNPLAILQGRAEVLLEERQEDPQLCKDLKAILKEAAYIHEIANSLLMVLSKERQQETYSPASPRQVFEKVYTTLEPYARAKGIALSLVLHPTSRVDMPAPILEEILRALIVNAVEATQQKEGGWVCLSLEPFNQASMKVILKVEDNGPGIRDEMAPHIFEPFVSRSPEKGRTGLGLFIVASYIDIYEGSIRYEKNAEGGATFIVEIPSARFTEEKPYHWFVSQKMKKV